MIKKKPKIIFIGNGYFASKSLIYMINKSFNIISIITNLKDKNNHYIIEIGKIYNIKLLNGNNDLNNKKFLINITKLKPDIIIIVSFKIISIKLANIAKIGTFNLHPSLLPNYKGAAPINWVLINGEKITGLTTFFISKKIDSGKIILQKKVSIYSKSTFKYLYKQLSVIGARLVVNTINYLIMKNKLAVNNTNTNDNKNLFLAPKIFNKDCRIIWSENNVVDIYNKIKGLNDYPGAWTKIIYLNKIKILKIYDVEYYIKNHKYKIGNFIFMNNYSIKISCNNGFIIIKTLQLENKKKITVKDFYNGIKNKNIIAI